MGMLNETMTVDGNSAVIQHNGGTGCLFAVGTFGTGTVKLQFSIDGETWVDVTNVDLDANGVVSYMLAPCLLRANLSGSTDAEVKVRISEIGLMRS